MSICSPETDPSEMRVLWDSCRKRPVNASMKTLCARFPGRLRSTPRNCSELRGNQQPAAFQEGIEAPGPRGAKERCQGHLLSLPASERVRPLILRLTTRWRRLRSAALLSGGVSGCETKTNNSLMCRSIRRPVFPGRPAGPPGKGGTAQATAFPASTGPMRNSPRPPPNPRL